MIQWKVDSNSKSVSNWLINKMHYVIVIFWICVFTPGLSRTDLSKNECPNMFSIKTANVTNITNQQMKSLASSFFSIYDNDYLTQSVDKIVVQGDPQALNDFITSRMMPYIAILVVFIVIFVTSAFCCVFDRSCPPPVLRRDLKKRPYTICQFRVVTTLTFIITFGIMIPGFVAFTYIPELKSNMQMTKCSVYVALDAVINGQKDTGWGGFTNLMGKIKNVTKYLQESLPAMSLYLSGDQWLIQEMQQMKQMNLDIYTQNKNATLLTPNPTTTKTAIDNGFSYPRIQSRFITKGMGPNGTSNTMVTDIDRALRTTQKLSTLAYTIEVGAKRIVDSSQTLLKNTNSSLMTLDMYISQLNGLKTSMDEFKSLMFESLLTYGVDLIEVSFGLLVLGGFCCMMGIIAAYKYEVFKCKSMVNLAWVLFGIGFMGSMILLFALLGMGSLGYGFCNYFDAMTTSQAQFSKLGASYSQNAFTKLDSCFFGDGNVLSKFNLGSQMGTVTKLFQLIKTYYDSQNQRSTNYVDKTISISKISSWMLTMQNYKDGVYVDFNESITTDDNPNFALNKMNLYTKGGAGVPVCAKDRWVFDRTNCTQANQTIYEADTAQNGVALQTTNISICISLNQKFSQLMTTIWTPSDLTRRYTQTRTACPNAYDKILDYAYSIIRFRDSRIDLFQGIHDNLEKILTKNVDFNNKLLQFKGKVQGFEYTVTDLSNVVSNSIDGLLVTADCRYIVDTLKFSYNSVCVNVMYDIVMIGWCAIAVAVFSAIGMVVSYIFACWFTDVDRNNKWFEEGYTGDDHIEIAEIAQVTSTDMLKSTQKVQINQQEKSQALDIGKDFQKLRQFATYSGGKSKKQAQREKQAQEMEKMKHINSSDSSEEQNPYAKELKQ